MIVQGLEKSGKSRLTTSWFDILSTTRDQSVPYIGLVGKVDEEILWVDSKDMGWPPR